ncbi:hypothetical protein ACWC9R_21955 [Streptomyces sp. NPDC001219]
MLAGVLGIWLARGLRAMTTLRPGQRSPGPTAASPHTGPEQAPPDTGPEQDPPLTGPEQAPPDTGPEQAPPDVDARTPAGTRSGT